MKLSFREIKQPLKKFMNSYSDSMVLNSVSHHYLQKCTEHFEDSNKMKFLYAKYYVRT